MTVYPKSFYYLKTLLVTLACLNLAVAQTVEKVVELPVQVYETSGLEYFEGNFLTHNDSGGKPILYLFSETGELLENYLIPNVKNKDWEDLTRDEDLFYISDTGNNNGSRKKLKILMVDPKKNFDLVGEIKINYKNQKNFEKRKKHPYDVEAIAALPKSLVLFSKNRMTFTTELYFIPKKEGSYSLKPKRSFPLNSLITGADYNERLKLFALVAYNKEGEQFIYTLPNFNSKKLEELQFIKHKIPVDRAQIEAIKIINQNTFWVTSEAKGKNSSRLFKIKI
ncbi:hypothetical protein N9H73_05630 [Flavobacteriaceae bacterium]|nr:hypothetical protein [Flavobacteriaceae bacterium]